jgi:hypothetical protein
MQPLPLSKTTKQECGYDQYQNESINTPKDFGIKRGVLVIAAAATVETRIGGDIGRVTVKHKNIRAVVRQEIGESIPCVIYSIHDVWLVQEVVVLISWRMQ